MLPVLAQLRVVTFGNSATKSDSVLICFLTCCLTDKSIVLQLGLEINSCLLISNSVYLHIV
jgi:hypothetical protein